MTNLCRIASATFLATCCVTALSAQTANAAARTVHTRNFTVAWNTGVDTEAITTLEWKGGANLTGMYQLNQCGNNDVVYFGNGFTPPDPEFGGLVLVGGGTTTPPGTIPWAYQAGSGFGQVTVNSSSTTCEPASTGVDVQTVYRFIGPGDTGVNWFQVQRVFDFSARPFTYELRPYISRLNISAVIRM